MAIQKTKRNKRVLKLWAEGWELPEIGAELGISKQRVFQIIKQAQEDRKQKRRLEKKTII